MSDCSTSAFKRPRWGDTEWRRLPGGDAVNAPAGIEPHVIEVELSDGTDRTKLLPLARGVDVTGMRLDGERWARAGRGAS